jgi:hypothetical protein
MYPRPSAHYCPHSPPPQNRLEECQRSIADTAGKPTGRSIKIDLNAQAFESSTEPLKISGYDAFKKTLDKDCTIAVLNPSIPKFAIKLFSYSTPETSCDAAMAAMPSVLAKLKDGTAPQFKPDPTSAITLDLCTSIKTAAIEKIKNDKIEMINGNWLRECSWLGTDTYVLSVVSGRDEDYTLRGQKRTEISDIKAYIDPVPAGCEIAWTGRRMDQYTTEEIHVRFYPEDDSPDRDKACTHAEALAKVAIEALPRSS